MSDRQHPPADDAPRPKSRIEQLIEAGVLRPPRNNSPRSFSVVDTGIRLPPGTVQQMIDEDRNERWP